MLTERTAGAVEPVFFESRALEMATWLITVLSVIALTLIVVAWLITAFLTIAVVVGAIAVIGLIIVLLFV